MTEVVGSIGRGDVLILEASTSSTISVGDILTYSSGYVVNGKGVSATTAITNTGVAGIALTEKDAQTTASAKKIAVQVSGLATVHVTEEGAATVIGTRLRLSATTSDLATVVATLGSTAAHMGYDPNYLGVVVVPAATTGATTSTATTAAVVRLNIP